MVTDGTCANVAKLLRPITFKINDKFVEITPESFLLDAGILDPRYRDVGCVINIMQLPPAVQGGNMFLLGDAFLRHFYSVYDWDN